VRDKNRFDVIIIGAGGAGLMCARSAGHAGARVLVIDHAKEPGRKILISGGGRCNFTNTGTRPDRFLSANPHFCKSALSRFTPADFLALVEQHRIAWHEKTLGQLFCDGKARQIVEMLIEETRAHDAAIRLSETVADISHDGDLFHVTTDADRSAKVAAHAPTLVLATGGPSIPKIGATGFAYEVARRFGLRVVEPRPALVPLKLGGGDEPFKALAGVSLPTIVRYGKTAFREASLFTHRGLSGPAILQISSYWRHGEPITVDFLPDASPDWLLEAKRNSPRQQATTELARKLPARLAPVLAERLSLGADLGNLRDRQLAEAASKLGRWTFEPTGTEGFAKAEVTAGGVSTADLSSRDMQAKKVPGLFFIGEAVDVTGWLGGYNFQWAWASGHVAGEAAAALARERSAAGSRAKSNG